MFRSETCWSTSSAGRSFRRFDCRDWSWSSRSRPPMTAFTCALIGQFPLNTFYLGSFFRSLLKKTDDALPRVELVEVGPSADFEVVRHKFASDGLMRRAMKKPKGLKVRALHSFLSLITPISAEDAEEHERRRFRHEARPHSRRPPASAQNPDAQGQGTPQVHSGREVNARRAVLLLIVCCCSRLLSSSE